METLDQLESAIEANADKVDKNLDVLRLATEVCAMMHGRAISLTRHHHVTVISLTISS